MSDDTSALWPAPAQRLLLRAAVCGAAEAEEAWRAWQAAADPDDELDTASHQLLPTVAWNLDLRTLKVLLRNSLVYSGLNEREKADALARWERAWAAWAQGVADGARSPA